MSGLDEQNKHSEFPEFLRKRLEEAKKKYPNDKHLQQLVLYAELLTDGNEFPNILIPTARGIGKESVPKELLYGPPKIGKTFPTMNADGKIRSGILR